MDNFKVVTIPEEFSNTIANELNKENIQLRQEIERLKSGKFTKEEFQNLCHSLPTSCLTVEEFCNGCEEYQKQMFGRSPITELREKFEDLKGTLQNY